MTDTDDIVDGLRRVAVFFAADAHYSDYRKHSLAVDRAIAALKGER